MEIDKKAFNCIYMLYRQVESGDVKKELGLSDDEYNGIIRKWCLDDDTQKDLASQSNGIGKRFMLLSRYPFMSESDQEKGIPCPPAFKKLEGSIYSLPSPSDIQISSFELHKGIEQRRSVRIYDEKPFSIEELSYLLWATQGVRLYKQTEKASFTMRTVPSAGARHALETYLLINHVDGIPAGLYFYDVQDHQLVQLNTQPDIAEFISQACWEQPMIMTSAVTFMWVAIPYRMSWRYGERTWRYLHLDAGHVCQDLYLAGENIDSGTCAIGAYSDELFAIALDLEIENEFVIYAATIGKKKV
jgi:SagB-type dehydrogenase family enzyme